MKKSEWKTIKAKLEKAVHKGSEILKEGGEGLWHMAEKTAELLSLESDIHGIKSQIARLSQQFGVEIHRSLKNGNVRITPHLKKLNVQMTNLDRQLKKLTDKARRLTIVKKVKPNKRVHSRNQLRKVA